MDNQMIIILALLLLFFMKNKKDNFGSNIDQMNADASRGNNSSHGWN